MATTYAIPNGRTVMNATTWTGVSTSSAITVSNADLGTNGFYPDLVWGKPRSLSYTHGLHDSNRGVAAGRLSSNGTTAETAPGSFAYGSVSAFNSNGFTTSPGSTDNENWNTTSGTYVAWQWNAGSGTNTTNTNGSITSTVSVNATAGFSIVTYTGTGVTGTIGHGLGVAPSMIIVKVRSTTNDWCVYHTSIGATQYMYLDTTQAASAGTLWNNTAPTSTVFSASSTGAGVNSNGATYVAYCWAPVAGFSAFGSYTGNGSADGPFVYLGFRPKFIIIKNSSATTDWKIMDTSRDLYNPEISTLAPDVSSAEDANSGYAIDYLSNGFKIRNTYSTWNGSGNSLIYAAFAENPFKFANAR